MWAGLTLSPRYFDLMLLTFSGHRIRIYDMKWYDIYDGDKMVPETSVILKQLTWFLTQDFLTPTHTFRRFWLKCSFRVLPSNYLCVSRAININLCASYMLWNKAAVPRGSHTGFVDSITIVSPKALSFKLYDLF
jgi:hypothetical protein